MSQYDRFESYASPAYGTIFAGHFNETDRYTTSRPGGMEDWLMTYTLSGEGYFHTPSGINQCYEGDLALLRSGVPHEYGAAPGKQWNFIWAHFPGLNETHYLPGEELIVQHLGNEHLQNRVYRALRNVLLDSREQRPLWRELCENEIRGILLLIADRSRDKLDPRVEQTLHYLSRHMREPIKIETVARAVGLSAPGCPICSKLQQEPRLYICSVKCGFARLLHSFVMQGGQQARRLMRLAFRTIIILHHNFRDRWVQVRESIGSNL